MEKGIASKASRREFLKSATAASAAVAMSGIPRPGYVAEGGALKAGLIGCGGRGRGAAEQALRAGELLGIPIQLVAIADVFKDRADAAAKSLSESSSKVTRENVKITAEMIFDGLDCHKKLLATDVNYVILATPPGFRPMHFEAAVEARKNVFTEKPVATEAAGTRQFMAAARKSEQLGLSVVAGTQRRHDKSFVETIKKIRGGEIGDLLAARCYWCGGPVFRERVHKPEWGDLEWQIRAWYSYCWIGGDNIVEQHVHNLDVINWALGAHPVRAFGSGGRAWKSKEFEYMGNIWDNFSIDYEYEIGGRTVHLMSMSRHWERSDGMNGQFVVGTKRESNCSDNLGQPLERDAEPSMVREHMNLIASITGKGPHFNEAMQVAESSFTAILGRESAYSGRRLSWDDLLQSGLDLMPKPLSFDAKLPTPTIPAPGTYQIPGLAQKGPQKGSQKERKQRKAKA